MIRACTRQRALSADAPVRWQLIAAEYARLSWGVRDGDAGGRAVHQIYYQIMAADAYARAREERDHE